MAAAGTACLVSHCVITVRIRVSDRVRISGRVRIGIGLAFLLGYV